MTPQQVGIMHCNTEVNQWMDSRDVTPFVKCRNEDFFGNHMFWHTGMTVVYVSVRFVRLHFKNRHLENNVVLVAEQNLVLFCFQLPLAMASQSKTCPPRQRSHALWCLLTWATPPCRCRLAPSTKASSRCWPRHATLTWVGVTLTRPWPTTSVRSSRPSIRLTPSPSPSPTSACCRSVRS